MQPVLRLYEDTLSSGGETRLPALPRVIFVVHGALALGDRSIGGGEAWHGEGAVIVRAGNPLLRTLEQHGLFDFALDDSKGVFAILDPLSADYFVKKRLRPALRAIRVPPLSKARPLFLDPGLTRLRLPNPNQSASVPAERFIWDADTLAGERSSRSADTALAAIARHGIALTPRQRLLVRRRGASHHGRVANAPNAARTSCPVKLQCP